MNKILFKNLISFLIPFLIISPSLSKDNSTLNEAEVLFHRSVNETKKGTTESFILAIKNSSVAYVGEAHEEENFPIATHFFRKVLLPFFKANNYNSYILEFFPSVKSKTFLTLYIGQNEKTSKAEEARRYLEGYASRRAKTGEEAKLLYQDLNGFNVFGSNIPLEEIAKDFESYKNDLWRFQKVAMHTLISFHSVRMAHEQGIYEGKFLMFGGNIHNDLAPFPEPAYLPGLDIGSDIVKYVGEDKYFSIDLIPIKWLQKIKPNNEADKFIKSLYADVLSDEMESIETPIIHDCSNNVSLKDRADFVIFIPINWRG